MNKMYIVEMVSKATSKKAYDVVLNAENAEMAIKKAKAFATPEFFIGKIRETTYDKIKYDLDPPSN